MTPPHVVRNGRRSLRHSVFPGGAREQGGEGPSHQFQLVAGLRLATRGRCGSATRAVRAGRQSLRDSVFPGGAREQGGEDRRTSSNSLPGSAWRREVGVAPPHVVRNGRRSLRHSVFPGGAREQGGEDRRLTVAIGRRHTSDISRIAQAFGHLRRWRPDALYEPTALAAGPGLPLELQGPRLAPTAQFAIERAELPGRRAARTSS
ncbi:hypothetical protein Mal15_08120 [Stieleria maiorica]|uniref:Uncharacterized protein n=1 Tax=Stieleria maiorica TaxID=2795974 RepID=A0A5B9M6Q0_9BACT|nr:hypothetical protein Mal15_08120 [Stieleria maiorica]